jgi:hypothetical protein
VLAADGGGALDASIDATTGDAQSASPPQGAPESAGADAEAAGPMPTAGLRFANWSPDSPGIDFCIAPHGTSAFRGPVLAAFGAGLGESCDAGAEGLSFPQTSAYELMAPQQYDVRVVVAGASDCSVKLTDDTTTLPALQAGALATLALVGEANPTGGDPGLEVVAFLDTDTSGTGVAVRFINAAANVPTAALYEVQGATAAPIFGYAQFAQAGTVTGDATDAAAPAAETYQTIPAPSSEAFEVRASTGAMAVIALTPDLSIAEGAVITLVLLGPIAAADGGVQAELLECADNAGTTCLLGACQIVAE